MGGKIYKIMIWFAILVWSVLIVENMIMSSQAQILIWYARTGTLTMFSLLIWAVFWFGIKWLIDNKEYNDDEDFNY